jgi:Penicillin-insensitive murein endopeptidase/Bacterial Ig domain
VPRGWSPWGVATARADIELAQPSGPATLIGRDGALVFRLRFVDQDVAAAIDGRAVRARRRGDLLRLRVNRLRSGRHLAVVRARTPGPVSRTLVRRVPFMVDARRPPLDVSIPGAVGSRKLVVRGRTEPSARVTVRARGRVRHVQPGRDGRFAIALPSPRTTTRLRVTARDTAGNRTVAIRRVMRDDTVPRVQARVPTIWHSPSHRIAVRVRDAAPVRMTLRIDGRLAAASAPSRRRARTLVAGPLPLGRDRLRLRAIDAAGNAWAVQRIVTVVVGEPIRWRRSRASGTPNAGRLHAGVRLPAAGLDFFTWNPARDRRPNPADRRWGTDRLVRTIVRVLREHRAANPGAPPVGVGDLSPRGGGRYARGAHLSHQNGLDADIYYPRHDRRLRAPDELAQVDRALAQDLVDRFVSAGAEHIFVDAQLGLRGPPAVIQHWPNHGDHLHVRLRSISP